MTVARVERPLREDAAGPGCGLWGKSVVGWVHSFCEGMFFVLKPVCQSSRARLWPKVYLGYEWFSVRRAAFGIATRHAHGARSLACRQLSESLPPAPGTSGSAGSCSWHTRCAGECTWCKPPHDRRVPRSLPRSTWISIGSLSMSRSLRSVTSEAPLIWSCSIR